MTETGGLGWAIENLRSKTGDGQPASERAWMVVGMMGGAQSRSY